MEEKYKSLIFCLRIRKGMRDEGWGIRSFIGKKLMRGCVDAIQVRASRDFYMPPNGGEKL